MDSSDDDAPLSRKVVNGVKSKPRISDSVDRAEDRKIPTSNGHVAPAISVRNGPAEPASSAPAPTVNGSDGRNKRKSTQLTNGTKYKELSTSEDEDDKPLIKRQKSSSGSAKKPPKATAAQIGEPSLERKLKQEKASIEKKAEKVAKVKRVKAEDSDDDVPLASKNPRSSLSKAKTPDKKAKKEESDSDVPLSKKPAAEKKVKPKATPESSNKPAKGKAKAQSVKKEDDDEEAEDDDDEVYRWWEDPSRGDGTKKWTTLEHNGPVFPPAYEPLPNNVRMKYDGKPVKLHPEAEEVAWFYGSMLHSTVNVENPTFNKNFFSDFKEYLDKTGHGKDADGNKVKIKEFEKCDFKPIFEFFEAERERKKNLPKEEKKRQTDDKKKADEPYQFCMWDGRKQKVGNFKIEPPGLFRGRGEHPKTGKVKKRVTPEQVTINIGENATVPAPPEGHRWKEIKHEHEGTWLATWQENINGNYKYVMLAPTSDIKGQSDRDKYEKARKLKKHIDRIRKDYRRDLKAKETATRQLATAVYLIDELALRAGNEKGEDEADTVGCCSLKYEHITLKPPNTVIFDFLGKDSIRYYNEVQVDEQVFKNLRIFKQGSNKNEGDEIFDRLTTTKLNQHLRNYMEGLTAKVFRTYNASQTFSNLIKKSKIEGTVAEKYKAYNDVNRHVAILCNHKRTVPGGHENQMAKLEDKIEGLRYQQWRLKQMMLDIEPKLKKSRGADYFALPEDMTKDWVAEHQAALVQQEREKITKKFQKDNEKRQANDEKPLPQKELDGRLEVANELEKKFKKENKTGVVEAEGRGPSVEKYEQQLQKLQERIETQTVQKLDKDENKEVALNTSKLNYIDPRLTVAFCRKFDVPIEKCFSKTLREKFHWAIQSADQDWDF